MAKSPVHSYSGVVEGNRLISIPTELVFGSFSHDPSTASPTLSLVGMQTVSDRADPIARALDFKLLERAMF